MPRILSPAAAADILGPDAPEVWLACLTISHPDMSEPIRIVNNTETVVRMAGEYVPWPFEAAMPDDTDTPTPYVDVDIDNIDRTVSRRIRGLTGEAPKATLEVILASSPNIVEMGPFEFSILSTEVDVMNVRLSLGYEEDILNQPFPAQSYTPTSSPGIWRN